MLAKEGEYDCLVYIRQPLVLIQRVRRILADRPLHFHCSHVVYNKGFEVDQATLNSQDYQSHVFQKDPCRAEDKEYRLSLTDVSPYGEDKDAITLEIGDCSDIMDIQDLPNLTLHGKQCD